MPQINAWALRSPVSIDAFCCFDLTAFMHWFRVLIFSRINSWQAQVSGMSCSRQDKVRWAVDFLNCQDGTSSSSQVSLQEPSTRRKLTGRLFDYFLKELALGKYAMPAVGTLFGLRQDSGLGLLTR